MSGIFISHSSSDNADAEALADRLRQQGYESLFLDFDPADGIPAGRDWEREIYAKLRACRGVILLCSERSMASDWCFAEITHARALGKHLFPVIISPCEPRPILRDTQIIDLAGDPEDGFRRLLQGLLKAGLNPADFFKWDETRPPYPGLVPFAAEDAAVYCGRDDDRRRCLDILEQMKRYDGERLLLLVGTSGSGKSSLARAGVVPRLARMADWQVLPPMRPRRQPIEELARTLAEAFSQTSPGVNRRGLAARLQDGGDQALLSTLDELQPATDQPRRSILLVVDQLEELLTTSDETGARRFVTLLKTALATDTGNLFCLATLRSDYLSALQSAPLWQHTTFREMSLGPLTPAHFTEIIARPAMMAGIELEPGLVETMVRDTGTADALPLLAFTLNRLWRDFGDDKRITLEEYRERIGGLEGAIRHEAEGVLATLNPTPQQLDALRRAFRSLVRIDDQGQYTRRPLPWRELPQAIHPLMEAFVTARLLVSGRDQPPEPGEDAAQATAGRTLEVAHEALFRAWDKLRRWLREDHVFLLWRQHLTPEAAAWQQNPSDAGLLLRGGPLAEAERWLSERDNEIDETLRGFILASRRIARRTRRIWRTLQGLIAVGLVAVSWLAFELWEQRAKTIAQLIDSYWSIGIAARDAETEKHAVRAAHYFARVADLTSVENEQAGALFSVGILTGGVELRGMLPLGGVPGPVRLGPGETTLALGIDNQAKLLDLGDGRVVAGTSHRGRVRKVLIAADRRLVALSQDGRVRVSAAASAEQELPHGGIKGMAVDAAGHRLLSWGKDAGIRLWDIAAGHEVAHLDLDRPPTAAAFLGAPDRVLVWSREDGSIHIWQPGSGTTERWETGCQTQKVVPSQDNTRLLSWCEKDLLLHDIGRAAAVASWASPDWIDGASFLPAGDAVVTWDEGSGQVRIWDTADGSPRLDKPIAHGGAITGVLLTPDGDRMLTSGADGRVKLWNPRQWTQLELARAEHSVDQTRVYAGLSGDGTRLLSWSSKAGARLWDTGTMTPLALPMLHAGDTRGAHFYNDDTGLVTWGQDATLRIWQRDPASEVTAPAARPRRDAEHAHQAVCTARLDESEQQALNRRLEAANLSGYQALIRCNDRVLVVSGSEGRVLALNSPADRRSPPLGLAEDIRGGGIDTAGRVTLWGAYSVRLWDADSGRPLSTQFISDVVGPDVRYTHEGLLTWDTDRARHWRWSAPPLAATGAEHWLQAVSGTRLDEQHAQTVMDHAAWCGHPRTDADRPVGCRP